MPQKLSEEKIRQIAELYPEHTHQEVASVVGCSSSIVYRTAKRLGLERTEAARERFNCTRRANLRLGRKYLLTQEFKERRSEKMKRRWQICRYKAMIGEEPPYNYRVAKTTNRKWQMRRRLEKRGYIVTDDLFTYLYDENTDRIYPNGTDKGENYLKRTYRIEFHRGKRISKATLTKFQKQIEHEIICKSERDRVAQERRKSGNR